MLIYVDLLRRKRGFRFLWLAAVVSLTGDWFNTIATLILVGRYTDSGLAISGLFLARTLPAFLLGPVVGVITDRFNRKAILVISDFLRAVVALGFLLVDRPEHVWIIYACTIAQFTISAFYQPSSMALLPGLAGREDLMTANVLSGITWAGMLAIGSALGGFSASLFGVTPSLILVALCYIGSALLLFQMKIPPTASPERLARSNSWLDFTEALRFLAGSPHIILLILVKGFGMLGSSDFIIALFARSIFPLGNENAVSLGLLYASAGVGSILGPIIAQRLTRGSRPVMQAAIVAGFAVICAAWLGWGMATSIMVGLLASLLFEMGFSANWTNSTVLIQTDVPDQFLGRVFAIDMAIFTMFMSLSMWGGGFMLDNLHLSPHNLAFVFAGASLFPLAASAAFAFFKRK